MPYIEGQSLEAVLQEVRRLRGQPVESPDRGMHRSGQAAGLALGLISGRPDAGGREASSGAIEPPPADEAAGATVVAPGSSTHTRDVPPRSGSLYVRSVARIGLQVAEALAYASERGSARRHQAGEHPRLEGPA